MRAISSADEMVASTLTEYVNSDGIVPPENNEAALSAVYQKAMAAVLNGTYKSAELNDNCVVIGLLGGGYFVYQASDDEMDGTTSAPGDSASVKAVQSTENTQIRQSAFALSQWNGITASSDSKYKIVTIQPYSEETQFSNPNECNYPDLAAETIVAGLDEYSFADKGTTGDDNRDDADVSVDFLKSLSKYGIVIWHGHGDYSKDIGSFLCITGRFSLRYFNDFREGRIIYFYGGNIGVTITFFDKYLQKNKNDNSLIYLGTCLSGKDSRLADAFLDKGFDCVVVNSEKIERTYNLNMIKAFFDGMSARTGEFLSAQEALENAKLIYGICDPYLQGNQAVPILYGDTTLCIAAGEQLQTSVTPVATEAPSVASVAVWAQAYADVLCIEKVGNSDMMLSPMVFTLLDMNGDGIPELIVAEIDGTKAEELVFTPNEVGAVISQYAVYTYNNSEAICIDTELIAYANSIFMIHNNRNIISGDAGTGYIGYDFLDYTNDQFRTFKLATEWDQFEEETYYRFGEVTADMKGFDSPPLPEISETEYNEKYDEIFSNITVPTFFDNTATMRSQVLGVH